MPQSTDPPAQHPGTTQVPDVSFPIADEPIHRLGEYELLEPLGQGGMGQVWKARHRKLGKLVAVKLIRPDQEKSHQAVLRFAREMRALGSLSHPQVVEASDAGESDGVVYLVMQLIEGEDLANYVRERGPLPVADACELARQVAVGLAYLHGRGLVHRDLKPSNLMRTPAGEVKILDFGLARWQRPESAENTDGLTAPSDGLGTPDYVAPEQTLHAASVDIRADLYALGCTLVFLLTGKAPFEDVLGGFAN
jgi:serine/threonine protein kinase